jgi:hypothetical protein
MMAADRAANLPQRDRSFAQVGSSEDAAPPSKSEDAF